MIVFNKPWGIVYGYFYFWLLSYVGNDLLVIILAFQYNHVISCTIMYWTWQGWSKGIRPSEGGFNQLINTENRIEFCQQMTELWPFYS
jgi:hypothetical protein